MTTARPHENLECIGHQLIEKQCLDEWDRGKFPHSLLLAGPKGIGKATFAHKLARFILAGGAGGGALFGPEDLSIDENHPVIARIQSGAHGDFHHITTDQSETDTIKIDDIRAATQFLTLTSAESAWRVVLIDGAENMNPNAANALLKTLEEPPSNAIIILVSHHPGKLLPTIRSRCRMIQFQTPSFEDFCKIIAINNAKLTDDELKRLYSLSHGSAGQALEYIEEDADKLYNHLVSIMAESPKAQDKAFQSILKKASDSKNKQGWHCFKQMWDLAMHHIIATHQQIEIPFLDTDSHNTLTQISARKPLNDWFELRESAKKWFIDSDILHLDRKQVIYSLLSAASGAQRI
ncbi:MAG: DNA polymerase III subunit delta' [Rickettsiales bacterium]|nr:DNA polymerase III subunit delta' [Rickettsiales bacterium]